MNRRARIITHLLSVGFIYSVVYRWNDDIPDIIRIKYILSNIEMKSNNKINK